MKNPNNAYLNVFDTKEGRGFIVSGPVWQVKTFTKAICARNMSVKRFILKVQGKADEYAEKYCVDNLTGTVV